METFEMKENNLLLEENIHVDEKELATSEEWKLPYKSLRYIDMRVLDRYVVAVFYRLRLS